MWHSAEELKSLGFKSVGKNVLISKKASVYGCKNITIGDNVRIDDFCVITAVNGNLKIDGYNHIGALTYINANGGVEIKKYAGLSSRCSIYSETDDYCSGAMTGSLIPDVYKNIISGQITIGTHVVIGTGAVIMPGVVLGDFCAVGTNTVITKNTKKGVFYYGNPAIQIKKRDIESVLRKQEDFEKREKNEQK